MIFKHYYLRHGEIYVFTFSVGSFLLSLSVCNITGKLINGFSRNYQSRWDLVQGIYGNIWGMIQLTICIQESFFLIFRESLAVSNIAEKWMTGFSWHFQGRLDIRKKNLEHFEDVALKVLDPGPIFLFSGYAPHSNIIEKRLNGFSWFFHDISGIAQINLATTFTPD